MTLIVQMMTAANKQSPYTTLDIYKAAAGGVVNRQAIMEYNRAHLEIFKKFLE